MRAAVSNDTMCRARNTQLCPPLANRRTTAQSPAWDGLAELLLRRRFRPCRSSAAAVPTAHPGESALWLVVGVVVGFGDIVSAIADLPLAS